VVDIGPRRLLLSHKYVVLTRLHAQLCIYGAVPQGTAIRRAC
jgi:hypothetical protein